MTFSAQRISFLVILFAQVLLAHCDKKISSDVVLGKSHNVSIESGGLTRSYLLNIPETYNGKISVPLILSFHGRLKNASEQETLSQFSNRTFNRDAISVYPQGIVTNGHRQWQGDPESPASINDVQFTLDMIKNITSTYCISSDKIFATGKSNGGGLVSLLACDPEASSIIAAFAPVSGAYYLDKNKNPPKCNPARKPIPILEFHGYEDNTIFYEGGNNTRDDGFLPPIPQWVDDWATRDGCRADSNKTQTLCGTGAKKVTRYSWKCDDMGDAVVHYNISNLLHQWPSKEPTDDGSRTTCFEATELILEWFGKHSLA